MNERTDDLVKPTMVRYEVLAWLCALSMITYIDRVCIKQVGEDIQLALGLTKDQLGLVFASFFLSYSLFEVPAGWLGDRYGPRRLLVRIVVWWSVFTMLTGAVFPFTLDSGYRLTIPPLGIDVPLLLNGFIVLLGIRFLFGAGEAGAYPNIARALRNWFPYSQRGLTQGWPWTFGRWGGALAPVLVGFFSFWFGWRGAFVVFGLMGVVWAIGFVIRFRDTPREHPHTNEAERKLIETDPMVPGAYLTACAAPEPPLAWRRMLASPNLWFLCLMYFCSNAGMSFFFTWDVQYFKNVLGLSGRWLELAAGAPLFFGGLGCICGGLLTDRQVQIWGRRWGRSLQGLIANVAAGLLFLIAALITQPLSAVGLLCLAAFIKDFAMATSWSACIDVGHRYSGTVAGVMNMLGNFGGAISSTLVPRLVSLVSTGSLAFLFAQSISTPTMAWKVTLYYAGGMFVLSGLFWLFINPRRVIVYSSADQQRLLAAGDLLPEKTNR